MKTNVRRMVVPGWLASKLTIDEICALLETQGIRFARKTCPFKLAEPYTVEHDDEAQTTTYEQWDRVDA